MVALAWLYGPMAPVPAVHADLVADRAVDDDHRGHRAGRAAARAARRSPPSARITGKYSGSAPAITALTATFSTVYSQCSRNWFERMWPTTSSGLRLVCASISATRFSVGRTIGSLSVQLFSRNRRCRFSSVSASTSRGVERSNLISLTTIAFGRAGESFDDLLHHRPAADRVLPST